jgi:hypothetical protein
MGSYRSTVQDRLVLPAQVLLTRETEQVFRLLGRGIPAAVPLRLMIDTGSGRSSLVPSVLTHLTALPYIGARVETGAGSVQTELYWVRLEFPGSSLAGVPDLAVARLPLPRSLQGFHGLVGRDLLGMWESFPYQGRRRRLTIRDTPPWLFGWFTHG